ncbi:DNA recombination protein RmuC [Variovorax sp. PAMC 28711]|uniref:DNA recombination protein RmuC n=1 Tax=Variovorax sp. PAMC 28711 TaxID=1795631 RepID=UPI00078B20D3|nr:DNA recombination protein RmuC [Variovorax sp. PAMC 28711]AMM25822.1 recombinase RmuC [Variovorax sp. PAMC 28711]
MNFDSILFVPIGLGVVQLVLLIWLLARRAPRPDHTELLGALSAGHERTERELRREIGDSARGSRQETAEVFARFEKSLLLQSAETTRTQNAQLDAFAQQLTLLQQTLATTLNTQLQGLSDSNAKRLSEVRETMERQLAQLQESNAGKLDEMRKTVDEKLQSTLEARLGESFKQVADRLEQVHRGLGEMQTLAQGVGDLKHLLTNVKTRGIFGEAQLGALLEQVFTTDQYAAQVATRPGTRNSVDFAIRLPGRTAEGGPLWLPIDAKFPNEDYERLLDAQQRADPLAAEVAGRALEARIWLEARTIEEKYIEPPHTTDFAILFLPTEGLYAEVLRRPDLMQGLQRKHRITLAGPTTLLAILNSLQMGFRTLALEKRSSEVWQVLGAVKAEFGKFGDVLSKVKAQTQTVLNTLDQAQTRSNVMHRALRQVEALPEAQSQALLPSAIDGDDAAP